MATIEALYCHLPFCHTICPFCAFAVHGNRPALHRPYLDALKREIALRATEYEGARQPIEALYFGGGTPSTLALEAVQELLDWIAAHYGIGQAAEVAFEVNPEDATPAYLRGLKSAGINRISLGLQSLDSATLAALGRNHDAVQGRRALEALRGSGHENYNVDLLYGAPSVSERAFEEDLEHMAAARPPHLSLYGLDLEEGTLFARNGTVREWMARHGPRQASQFLYASEFLTAQGYRHYEVSNYCLPGREGRQNLVVWRGGNYLGFGTGAHSHRDGTRWHNERHLRIYQRRLEKDEPPVAYQEELSGQKMANEGIMLALRQADGLDIPQWERRYGFSWAEGQSEIAERLRQEGKAHWNGAQLALTPQGFLLADEITTQLMLA
ncbi:MAG: radical SAM family heme chaperone HemW [SAR324 cluster bacterium]|nr:radical SAM family heme chaperone HemW [SAR324 cluster bacterium]MCZ6728161.1 radical SAM family heme chaperone HemW [SAR324 cluster bacterium]MCZ6843495.1 radical SAM family heme chaperone HemW [SAR324 cluster bacterium]